MECQRSPYEVIPYEGTLVPNTSPSHLALCSLWHKGPRPPLNHFRLTELGCGDASNLISLALAYPDSTFIGVDSSRQELALARNDVRNLGRAEIAPCDYLIAHGLYSWVAEDAREAILNCCSQSLTASGLAYISYNAQPGWATRRLVREALMRSPSVRDAQIEQKATEAVQVAISLLEDMPSRDYAAAVLLAKELERVRDSSLCYVYHEYLAEVNEGFWLRDFVEGSRRHGLEYVADAQFCRWEGNVSGELQAALARRSLDGIEREETADLLGDRYFRASILCRANVKRAPTPQAEVLEEVHLATSLTAECGPLDLSDGVIENFVSNGGPQVTLSASVTKAAVVLLAAQWPRGMPLEWLCHNALKLLTTHGCSIPPAVARSQLANDAVTLFEAGQMEFRLREPVYNSHDTSDHPRVHALARFEAERRTTLTTPFHLPIVLEPQALCLVRALDGSRSRVDLGRAFGGELTCSTLNLLRRWGLLESAA
jgi:methyltransferase-like protein